MLAITVTTIDDVVDLNDGVTSLREAIFAANTVPGADTIEFSPGLTADEPATILLTRSELQITESLRINGPGGNLLAIDAQQQSRIFNITDASGDYAISGIGLLGGGVFSASSITLVDTIVSHDAAAVSDAGIRCLKSVTLIGCTVSENNSTGVSANGNVMLTSTTVAANLGRGVASSGLVNMVGGTVRDNRDGGVLGSTVTITDGVVSGNSRSRGSGGGIQGSTVVLNNSTVSGNSTSGGIDPGGGIYAWSVTLNQSTVSGNSTSGSISDGGGIHCGSLTMNQSTVSGNSTSGAISDGGGIYCSRLTMNQSTVSGNSANGNGGGIYAKSTANIAASTVTGNSTSDTIGDGGGIFSKGNLRIDHSTVSKNSTSEGTTGGGGVYCEGIAQIYDCSITDNTAAYRGGGIFVRSTGSLSLNRTVVRDNRAYLFGGGVVSGGVANISGCVIAGNEAYQAAGIGCLDLTVRDSYVTGNIATGDNGGGIHVFGELKLINSFVNSNEAARNGGGVYCYGNATVEGSTISNNVASLAGGGIVATESLNVSASTVSQNRATSLAGGIWCRGGPATISHSTIFGNQSSGAGGGMFMDSNELSLDGAIISGNYAQTGPDATGLLGASIHARFSLIGNNSGSGLTTAPVGLPDASGNLIGGSTYDSIIDARLGPLADNGGGTPTHALLPDSPALDAGEPIAMAGNNDLLQFDQRGGPFLRVFHGRIDMGAYERQSLPVMNFVVDSLSDEYDGDFSTGHLSLREAIGMANGNVGSEQVITFAPELAEQGPAVVLLTRGDLTITDPLRIDGPGAELLTVDARGNDRGPNSGDGSRVLSIDDGDYSTNIVISVSGLTLTGGDIADGGGAILSRESLTISNSTIRDNFSQSGGGIYSFGPLALIDSTVSGNSASGRGGGISNNYALTTIIGATIVGNSAVLGDGGGIAISGSLSALSITGTTISDNYANGFGGGIYSFGVVNLTDDVVSRNSAQGGGGICAFNSLSLTSTLVSHNTASTYVGGGIQVQQGNTTITASAIVANSAPQGGGIATSGQLSVTASEISGNSATSGNGGGIFAGGGGTASGYAVEVVNSTLSNNSALQGGGLSVTNGNAAIRLSTISANVATDPSGRAGGVFIRGQYLYLDGSIIAGNESSSAPDLVGSVIATHTLIGDKAGTSLAEAPPGSPDANGNLIGGPAHGVIDPLLGPLVDNGGLDLPDGSHILSHALLPGSPAIDAGDPVAVAGQGGVPLHDQRGAPFTRVFGGRIDIGAVESIPTGLLPGDFSLDGAVDAADYSQWRDSSGAIVPAGTGADGNGDGKVDQLDYDVWKSNFGSSVNELPALTAGMDALPMAAMERGAAALRSSLAPPSMEASDCALRPMRDSKIGTVPQTTTNRRDSLLAWWRGIGRERLDRSIMHIDLTFVEGTSAGDARLRYAALESLDRVLPRLR
ncbi:MAG: choice-of-anchor Q domain-containing protein [Pirellulales bacterium]